MENQLPQWDLSDLFPSLESVEYQNELQRIVEKAKQFQEYRTLFEGAISPEILEKAIKDYEDLEIEMLHAFAFCQLQYDVDTTNEEVKKAHSKAQQLIAETSTTLEFFSQGVKKIDEKNIQDLIQHPALHPYAHVLTTLRLYAPYTLPEAQERLLTLKSVHAGDAWGHLHTELSSLLEFGTLTIDGQEKKMTPSLLKSLVSSSPDPEVRKAAYERVREPFGKMASVYAYMYQTIVNDHEQEARDIRGFASGIAESSLGDEVEVSHVDHMMEVTKEYVPLFRKYYAWKKEQLGLKEFFSSDLSAPLHSQRKEIPFSLGKEYVLGAFHEFHEDFGIQAEEFFTKSWIDARQGQNKYAGAYCYSMNMHPYILLNYQPDYQQVFTMAHELGHGVHFMFARAQQPFLLSNTSKVIAESASQFSELLLLDYLMGKETDVEIQKDLLATHIDDLMYCLFSAITVTRFERESHDLARTEGISTEILNDLWEKAHKDVYGDVVQRTEQDKFGWTRIPHMFQSPFYYFTYPMSLLVVLACYAAYQEQGKDFAPHFKAFLAKGGSMGPKELIQETLHMEFGSQEFFRYGFSVLESLVNRLLRLS